jgi:hypothetical protein
MLKRLISKRTDSISSAHAHPVYTGNVLQAMFLIRKLLDERSGLRPCDVAILSRKLDKRTVAEIKQHSEMYGLTVQLHSTRADRAMEDILGAPPSWPAGTALNAMPLTF